MEDDFDLVDELSAIIDSEIENGGFDGYEGDPSFFDDPPEADETDADETEADEIEADASDYAFGSESYGDFESADDYWASYDGDI